MILQTVLKYRYKMSFFLFHMNIIFCVIIITSQKYVHYNYVGHLSMNTIHVHCTNFFLLSNGYGAGKFKINKPAILEPALVTGSPRPLRMSTIMHDTSRAQSAGASLGHDDDVTNKEPNSRCMLSNTVYCTIY